MQITLGRQHGYIFALTGAFWFQQSIIFSIKVGMARKATGINPPTLYPNDSLIKELKLTPEQVDNYNCCQRVHQNNMEFLCAFMPIFVLSGFINPLHTAYAGTVVLAGRMATAIGYWQGADKRVWGAWWHFGELYCVYIVAKAGFDLIKKD